MAQELNNQLNNQLKDQPDIQLNNHLVTTIEQLETFLAPTWGDNPSDPSHALNCIVSIGALASPLKRTLSSADNSRASPGNKTTNWNGTGAFG